jgi:hypothetical protein
MHAGFSFSYSSISVLLRQPLSIKRAMQERYTPLSREAGSATHCLFSFSSVTFTSTVEELLPMFGSPLMMGAG